MFIPVAKRRQATQITVTRFDKSATRSGKLIHQLVPRKRDS